MDRLHAWANVKCAVVRGIRQAYLNPCLCIHRPHLRARQEINTSCNSVQVVLAFTNVSRQYNAEDDCLEQRNKMVVSSDLQKQQHIILVKAHVD